MTGPVHESFSGLYARLVRSSAEPENAQGCWTWTGKVKARYPRLNIRTGDGRHKEVRAHRAMLALFECGEETELFWQVYELFSVAKLEGDHLCTGNSLCINPDHLRWLTRDEHDEVTRQRGQGLNRRWSKDEYDYDQ